MRTLGNLLNYKLTLAIQVAGTLAVIAWIPGNIAKTAVLLAWWILTFRLPSRREIAMYCVACAFFAAMDVASLRQGIFSFTEPDLLGLPAYEYFMWGFYLLHTKHFIEGHASRPKRMDWVLVVLFIIAFGTIHQQIVLLIATGALFLAWIALAHEPQDLAYAGYMVLLGAAVEYTGVWSGQWAYPGNPPGGVPLWFISLWGGVGMALGRLLLPIVGRPLRRTDTGPAQNSPREL